MFVLPVNRDVRSTKFPVVVVTLMAVNISVFLLQLFIGPQHTLFAQYGFTPAHAHVLTVFTSMFMHSGFWHILGNMWFFWMFGPQVEDKFGSMWFGVTYLICGVAGAALHYVFNVHSTVPCVGASGAISGIAGIFFVLFPQSPFELVFYLGYWRIKSLMTKTHAAIGTWIGEQTLLGLLSQATGLLGVAFWAHVGGFAAGAAAGVVYAAVVPKKKQVYFPVLAPEPEEEDAFSEEKTGITQLNLNS